MKVDSITSLGTILVVDDDPDIRDSLSDMLEYEGYRIHAVGTGKEAIQLVRQECYQAVVLDMHLPDLHGLSVMKFLMESDPKLPIITITAYTAEHNTIGSLKRGAFAYITKPYNSAEIKATLQRAVEFRGLSVKAERAACTLSESEERFRIVLEEERKQAEQALRKAYGETEKILASLPNAILLVNEDQRITYANSLAHRYFGAGRDTLLGSVITEVLPLKEARRSQLILRLKPHSAESGYWRQDHEFETQQRVYRYHLFSMAIHGGEHPQTGFVIRDVTEEKQLLGQLIQAEKLAGLGTMVSGMAHEINNPAQAILGLAELMVDESAPETLKEYARDIVGYSKHLGTVVRDFVGYTRSASTDAESDVDLNERLTEAVKMIRRGPHFGSVEVVTDFQPLPPLRARRAEIEQLFTNLIGNAVQAMGGSGRLTLATHFEDRTIAAVISDTGCGIPRALVDKIFDPFFTTKEPGKGTGLGLSIAHKIATKYGGTISVESEEQKGTTFTITFPVEHRPE